MTVIERIFKALGGQTEIAKAMNLSVQTVDSWKKNGNVPRWRRAPLLEAANRLGVSLDHDALSYLASNERAAA